MSDEPLLVLDVRHRTCDHVPSDDDPPVMDIERVEDDMAIYRCPMCNHKISLLLFFKKPEG